MLIWFSQRIKKPRGVSADFLAQFTQRHKFAAARGHRNFFASPVERGKLDQQDREQIGIEAKRGHRGLHPLDVTMVICTPNVNHPVKLAAHLILMIGNVSGKVSMISIRSQHDSIFLVAKVRGSEPPCAIVLIENRILFQLIDSALNSARVNQTLL